MFIVLFLCTALSLHAAKESSTKEFAVPDLPPFQAALEAIGYIKPDLALAHYVDIKKEPQRREVLERLLRLSPNDYDNDTLIQLVDALETWNNAHLSRKIELPSTQWTQTLTKASPLLKQQYDLSFQAHIDKPPKKIMSSPIPDGMVRLYSSDNYGFDFLQIYAMNPSISGWLANVFKDASRTSIKVPSIPGALLDPLLITLRSIGELWVWAVDNFPTKTAREAQIIKLLNEHIESNATTKGLVNSNIFEMIKAADAIEAPLARKIYLQRLEALNKSPDEIKKNLAGYSHLWPDWVKKGK